MKKFFYILIILFTLSTFSQENKKVLFISECGFSNILLKMSSADVKKELKNDKEFIFYDYTESLLPFSESPIIECAGAKFIDKGVFYFDNDSLYSIELFLNRYNMDFWTMFNTVTEKYGKHTFLSPKMVKWEDENYSIILDRNLNLKYLDKSVHKKLLDESLVKESNIIERKKEFLDKVGVKKDE